MAKAHTLRITDLTVVLLCSGSILHRETKNTHCDGDERTIYEVCVSNVHYALTFVHWNWQGLKEKPYRIIPTSPEMCLGNSEFTTLFKELWWSCSFILMVTDEAGYTGQQVSGTLRIPGFSPPPDPLVGACNRYTLRKL